MIEMTLLAICAQTAVPPPLYPPTKESVPTKGHAIIDLSTDVGWIGPQQEFNVVVTITPDSGWHTYWENPGDSGAATEIEIKAPEGYNIGKPNFPRPEIFISQDGTTYGYSEQAAIFVPVKAPAEILEGRVEFQVKTTWFACNKNCVRGEDNSTLSVSVRTWEAGPQRKSKSLSRWQSCLPRSFSECLEGSVRLTGSTLRIKGETTFSQVGFLGIDRRGVQFSEADFPMMKDNSFTLLVPVDIDPMNVVGKNIVVEGLLTLGSNRTDPSFVVKLIIDPETIPTWRSTTK